MKILLVSELIPLNMIGGLARHCITLGNHLLKMGHEVHLMGNANFPYDDNVDFKGRFFTGFRLNWALDQTIGKYTGVSPYPLYRHFSKQIAHAINKIARQYDVIHYHGHYPMVANYIPVSANYIQTRHDYGTFCPNKHYFRFSDRVVCSSFTPQDCSTYCFMSKIGPFGRDLNIKWFSKWRDDTSNSISGRKTIFVSEKALDISLKVLGMNKTPTIFVVHNFIDTKAILSKIQKQPEGINISEGKNKVMIASALVPPKGVYAFLKAYEERGYNFPVIVAGRGSELPIIQAEFKDHPVTYLGWLSHEDTLRHMLLHQAFAMTSLLEEPCPTTVLEAMFLNKPVFALKRGGVPEMRKYSLYDSQLSLFDSMEGLVDGVANHLDVQSTPVDIDLTSIDFGACVSKKALEIIMVYNI